MDRFWHRRVITRASGRSIARDFTRLGWTQSTHLIMAHRRSPDRPTDTSGIREVSLPELEDGAHARHPRRALRRRRARSAAARSEASRGGRRADAVLRRVRRRRARCVLRVAKRRDDIADRGREHARSASRPRARPRRRRDGPRAGRHRQRDGVHRGAGRRLAEGPLPAARVRRRRRAAPLPAAAAAALAASRADAAARAPACDARRAARARRAGARGHPRSRADAVRGAVDGRRRHAGLRRGIRRAPPRPPACVAAVGVDALVRRVPRRPPDRRPGAAHEGLRAHARGRHGLMAGPRAPGPRTGHRDARGGTHASRSSCSARRAPSPGRSTATRNPSRSRAGWGTR